jgi:hypothetical protein
MFPGHVKDTGDHCPGQPRKLDDYIGAYLLETFTRVSLRWRLMFHYFALLQKVIFARLCSRRLDRC